MLDRFILAAREVELRNRSKAALTTTLWMLASVCNASAQTASPAQRLAQFKRMVDAPVVFTVPGMETVRVLRDLQYSDASEKLKMDVYTPATTSGPLPVVLFVHGGVSSDVPYPPKEWGIYKSWGRLVAASGMAAFTFNHRLGFPDPQLQEVSGDVRTAIDFVRAHASEFRIDPEPMCIATYSAGGPLLAEFIAHPDKHVRCLVKKFLTLEAIEFYSAATEVRIRLGDMPPMFIGRGGRDQIAGIDESVDAFVCAALEVNAPITLGESPAW
jgi:acetyl esterase/lipase